MKHSAANASQSRARRAYAVVKHLAMASGHMRHERDVEGFDVWCEQFEKDNEPVEPKPVLPQKKTQETNYE